MSIEEASLAVPTEHRARFLRSARLVAERASACRSSEVELALALRVLSVMCGAASVGTRGPNA